MPNRRHVLASLASLPFAGRAHAGAPREITWDDLIPADALYSEMLGEFDPYGPESSRLPQFDENGYKFVTRFDGDRVKLPGYAVPFDFTSDKVSSFLLAPYLGACIHVPPPPPNQLVFVTLNEPYPTEGLYDAIWVTGTFQTGTMTTELAESGYQIAADKIEIYQW